MEPIVGDPGQGRSRTLGDNRKVDFSRAMIFMTSNLGASEMSAIMSPKLGFNVRANQAPIRWPALRTDKMSAKAGSQRHGSRQAQVHAGVHEQAG